MTDTHVTRHPNREGFALVTALLIVVVLTVLALGAAWIAGSEKKTSFASGVHISSVLSADAGGEMAINFLRLSETPPPIIDFANDVVLDRSETTLHDDQRYEFTCAFDTTMPRPGWDTNFLDFQYFVETTGGAAVDGSSDVDMVTVRLFKVGYN